MNRVFLFVTDASAYMVKAANGLKILYTNIEIWSMLPAQLMDCIEFVKQFELNSH